MPIPAAEETRSMAAEKDAAGRRVVEPPLEPHVQNFRMVTSGSSMAPLIQDGDMVDVARVPAESLALGDIVVFRRSAEGWNTVTHRLVWIGCRHGRLRYYTKGDALEGVEYFEERAFVGRVGKIWRGGAALKRRVLRERLAAMAGLAGWLVLRLTGRKTGAKS